LRQQSFRERLLSAATAEEILDLFNEYETPAGEYAAATVVN
jgi:hypothetical protein